MIMGVKCSSIVFLHNLIKMQDNILGLFLSPKTLLIAKYGPNTDNS